jgi:hypothetical protein
MGIADRNREKAEAECQHQDIQHGMLLLRRVAGAKYLQVRAAAECGQSTWNESPLAT